MFRFIKIVAIVMFFSSTAFADADDWGYRHHHHENYGYGQYYGGGYAPQPYYARPPVQYYAQFHNISYPENSPERAQQKAQEDKALDTFIEALNKFDYANSSAQNRVLELETGKIRDRIGVPVRYESSFWENGSLVFPKEMTESTVRATLVKLTNGGETPPLDGNQQEGYSITISDLASAAPDLVNEAKVEQQKEVLDLKVALTDAANKTLEAHGWDLTGINHRWQKRPADSLLQTAAVSPKAVTVSAANNSAAAEIQAGTTYALVEPPPALAKPESIEVKNTVVSKQTTRPLPIR